MILLRLFGRCRIYHDPVTPILKEPAQIGWESWFRTIELVTPRRLKGRELLIRARGWWTVDPEEVAEIVESHGKLLVGKEGELLVELSDEKMVGELSEELARRFKDQILLAP